MAPAVILDNVAGFDMTPAPAIAPAKADARNRTLLLAPPSVAAHPELLNRIFQNYDRSVTDLQMLDRLALGIVHLPASAYDVVLFLTDADGTRSESQQLLGRDTMTKIVSALKAGGHLRSQDGLFGATESTEKTEAILAGLVSDAQEGMLKPESNESVSVPLRLRKKANGNSVAAVPLPLNGKRKSVSDAPLQPVGVGFVDFSDDLDLVVTGEDDDLIDEDTLLTEEDLARPVQIRESTQHLQFFCCYIFDVVDSFLADLYNYVQHPSAVQKLGRGVEPARTAPVA